MKSGYAKVTIKDKAAEAGREVAGRIAALIREKAAAGERVVLGLATGSTPLTVYRELVRMHRDEGLSFLHVLTFNLDEYYGLAGDHPQSYRAFMNQQLFNHIDVPLSQTHVLDGAARSAYWECQAFEARIRAVGGLDLWLLGIGVNGHIAFNEPGSSVDSRTRLVHLAPQTIDANSDGRFFKRRSEVPRCALSVGIGTIREARHIVLLALGAGKAKAVAAAVEGPFTPECPASLLQDHENVTFVLDAAAASGLGKGVD